VVKFVAGLIQTNRQSDKTAAQVSTLLDGLQTTAQGNTMTMNLAIPEATLEQMINMMRSPGGKKTVPHSATPQNK
jgi:flagellar motor switch protein FliM